MKYLTLTIIFTLIASCGNKNNPKVAAEKWCDCYSDNADSILGDSLIYEYCLNELMKEFEFIRIHIEVFEYPPLYDSIYSSKEVDSVRSLVKEFNLYSKKRCPMVPFL